MKLKSVPALFGKTMKIHEDQEVTFDAGGVCTVKDSLGKELLEKYPDMIFDENFIAEAPKTRKQEFDHDYAETLTAEINLLTEQVKAKSEEVEVVEADKKAWMDKVGELVKERDEAVTQLKNVEESTAGEIKLLKLQIELLTSTKDTMRKMCEMSEYPETEWGALGKEDLIKYIISKS